MTLTDEEIAILNSAGWWLIFGDVDGNTANIIGAYMPYDEDGCFAQGIKHVIEVIESIKRRHENN